MGRAWRWYGAIGVLLVVAYARLSGIAHEFIYDLISASAAVALALAARRSAGPARRAWAILAAAQCCNAVADAGWSTWYLVHGELPSPSVLDVLYLGYYPAAAYGMYLLVRLRNPGPRRAALTDALTASTGVALTVWVLALHGAARDTAVSVPVRAITVAYPIADLVLLTGMLWLAFADGRRPRPFRMIVLGVLAMVGGDLVYAVASAQFSVETSAVTDPFWLIGYLAFGSAALHPDADLLTVPAARSTEGLSRLRVSLLAGSGLLAPGLLVLDRVLGEPVDVPAFVLGSALLCLMLTTRLGGLVRRQQEVIARERTLREAGLALVAATDLAGLTTAVTDTVRQLTGPGYEATVLTDPERVPVGPDGRPARQPQEPATDGGTRLLVPLVTQNGPRGALVVAGRRRLDDGVQASLVALATKTALAVESMALIEERRRSDSRFRSIVQTSSDIMCITDPIGIVTWCGQSVERISGYRVDDLVGHHLADFLHPDDAADLHLLLTASREPGSAEVRDARLRMADQSYRVFQTTVRDLTDDPAVAGFVFIGLDVTDRRRLEDQLRSQAFHDPLTGLANRPLFVDRLEHALSRRIDGGPRLGVLFVDLDDFKTVNDGLGHHAGDELLKQVAERLTGCLRGGDTAARFGGDEFAILVEQTTERKALQVADRILRALAAPFALTDREVFVRASVGVALAGEDADDPATLLRNADVAMYHAKGSGKGRYEMYRASMHTLAMTRLELQGDLQRALENGELVVHYQPIVDLPTGRLASFEALARWHHPTRGTIPPADFVPLAEETGLIVPLGRLVLVEAVRQATRWRQRFHPGLTMAVNVSMRQLAEDGFVGEVAGILAESGLPAANLTLEMTESVFMNDVDGIASKLAALKQLGVRFAIDDFGTGYSSLSYLEQIPMDVLKIDRSFVSVLLDPSREPTLVHMILELARRLGVPTVAEGIEELSQLAELRALGCHNGQGYLFSPALDAAAMEAAIDRGDLDLTALARSA